MDRGGAAGACSRRPLIAVFLFLCLAIYCAVDPFRIGPMVDFPGFETFGVDLAPWSALPPERDLESRLQGAQQRFLGDVQGPESVAFDVSGRGPYTGVADGRVVFWDGKAWSYFAHTSPNRSCICDPKPSVFAYLKNEHICGRPLGIRFHKRSGDLYIADAYFGLLKVGPEGGLATPLAIEAEGIRFNFTNDLDIDEGGSVYFTDSSTNYQRRNFLQLISSSEPTGRLLRYDPMTKETIVLLRNLQFPNGVSLSKDESFIVYCEGSLGRLSRYWLKGERAGMAEVFAILPGIPDNVRTNEDGDFWVAIHARRHMYGHVLALYPRMRKLVMKLPIPVKYHYFLSCGGKLHAMIMKYSPEGKVLQVLEDREGKTVRFVSEVEEKDGKLWLGSVLLPFIAVYDMNSSA